MRKSNFCGDLKEASCVSPGISQSISAPNACYQRKCESLNSTEYDVKRVTTLIIRYSITSRI